MPTPVSDLIPMFNREINPPGFENFDLGAGENLGYIEDGFWDARLSGIFTGYQVVDGGEFPTPLPAGRYFTDTQMTGDLSRDLWMMIVVFAGFRILRLKILNLAINFKAVAGPTSYEQQASATTLRAMLDSLAKRIMELKSLYSDQYGGAFFYMDGVLQSEYAHLNQLAYETIVL